MVFHQSARSGGRCRLSSRLSRASNVSDGDGQVLSQCQYFPRRHIVLFIRSNEAPHRWLRYQSLLFAESSPREVVESVDSTSNKFFLSISFITFFPTRPDIAFTRYQARPLSDSAIHSQFTKSLESLLPRTLSSEHLNHACLRELILFRA
jgi:hypothetical protein